MARIGTSDATRMADPSRANVIRGAKVGASSALIMLLAFMILSAATGSSFFTPVRLIGATYLGDAVDTRPVWSAALGLVTHLAVGAGFGALFIALARKVESRGRQLAAGLVYGAAIFVFMTFLVLPWADPIMYRAVDRGLWFFLHLLYGGVLSFALRHSSTGRIRRRRSVVV